MSAPTSHAGLFFGAACGLVWLALTLFTYEALRARRRQLALVAEASAV